MLVQSFCTLTSCNYFKDSCADKSVIFIPTSSYISKVLHRSFLGSSLSVYKFLVWLVEQARRVPKIAPLSDIHRSLNRLILFEVSHIPSSEMEQKSFMDLLCLFSSQAHVIFDETNIDDQFLECLLFCLLRIVMYEKFLGRNPLLVKMNSFDGKDGGGGGGGGKGMSSMASASAAAFVDFSSLQDQLPSGYDIVVFCFTT